MNTVRLVFGWLFLAGFTAAGTYYAMDEVDSRIGLAKFNLHEKLGITRYAVASVPPPIQPPVNNPAQVITPVQNPQQPAVQPPPIQTSPTPIVTPPGQNPQQQQNPQPQPITPVQNPQQQPITPVQNPVQPPINNNPNQQYPPASNPQQQRQVYTPPQQQAAPPASRPADFTETNIRFMDLKGRVDAMEKFYAGVSATRFTAERNTMKSSMRAAADALRGGDTASARRYMAIAEEKLEVLRKFKEE